MPIALAQISCFTSHYLQYLNKYREYQRFDTSIEEVSIYRSATIPQSIVTIPVSIVCCLQLNRSIVDNYVHTA